MDAIRKRVVVACSVEHAFEVFTRQVDAWWPRGHRRFGDSELRLEGGAGGRLVEVSQSGEEHVLGGVVDWDPPHLLRFSWRLGAPPQAPTLATVRFAAEGDGTLVAVEHVEGPHAHPDWTASAVRFDRGWTHVLAALAAHLDPAPAEPEA